jgi:Rrf2 family protein
MSGIFRISEAANLALHALAYLAHNRTQPAAVRSMALYLKVSEAHLAKVMQRLEKSGMVRGKRGPVGGFTLNRAPELLFLKEIYETMEGPLQSSHCLLGEVPCNGKCPLSGLMKNFELQISAQLGKISVADFAAKCGVKPATKILAAAKKS